jgi:dihydroorotase
MRLKLIGMLDPHTHLRDMEWTHKGTFATETEAAVFGGYWAVFDMPNTFPSTVDAAALAAKRARMAAQAVCDWGIYYGAGRDRNWLGYGGEVYAATCGLKIYNNDTTGNLLIDDQHIREQHYAHWTAATPIAVHAENETVLDILALVRQYRRFTHFVHICTAQEIGYLRAAKAEGLPISVGVCPHHLFLTEDDLPRLGAYGWMKPTLKTAADRDALWQAIADGVVDVIESDHAPHTHAEKASAKPPYGVPGLQTTLPLMLTAAREGRVSLARVIEMLTANPCRLFGVTVPPETYTIVDIEADYVIDHAQMRSLCGWTPFAGMRVWGQVREVWMRGVQVFDGEKILVQAGFGQQVQQTVQL